MRNKQLRGNLLLLLTAMIWGAAFVAQSVSMDYVGAFTFLCTRSILGGVVLLPLIGFNRRRKPEPVDRKALLQGGLACGAALFVASALQQIGIQYTTSGKAGFITAMYVVLVPLTGLFLGKSAGKRAWTSVAAALVGLYLLCFSGGGLGALNRGDLLEMACALGFTVHILVIDRFSSRVDGIQLSCIQFFVCGILGFFGMIFLETPTWASIRAAALPILYAGVLSSGVGYTLQIVAQRDTDPTVASLLMSLESVFSLVFGWLLLHERMTLRELLGCVLMFAAIVWVQLPDRNKPKCAEK
jgi:drug/metabolite transporter (DMT)-like permease